MASLRSTANLFRHAFRQRMSATRGLSSKTGGHRALRPLLLGVVGVGAAAYGAYHYQVFDSPSRLKSLVDSVSPPSVSAAFTVAPCAASQPSVYSEGKTHGLYLWIHVKPTANPRAVASCAACLQKYVNEVSDPETRDEEDEILAGVGFSTNFYQQVGGSTKKNYCYRHRKGPLGDMPCTGGDIFIHAKSNTYSKLFELTQAIMASFPKDSIECFEDIYSFVYKNGRDLSGFIDGTENPQDEDTRKEVAVEKETGGSYALTQLWIHDMDLIGCTRERKMECWVGRTRADSTELTRKPPSSHVARMTGGNALEQPKKFQIVRQSMPYGTLASEAGLFFMAYASSPENFNFMLDRMVGCGGDPFSDDIMRLSRNVKGNLWYFPSCAELKCLV